MTRRHAVPADDFPMPGADRERTGYAADRFPFLIHETMRAKDVFGRQPFPFRSWASANRFAYRPESLPFLLACQSAPEAFFARAFAERPSATFEDRIARADGVVVELQARAGLYRLDAAVSTRDVRLAIEVDGLSFHVRKADQVTADYLRQRRIVCAGFVVVRFTAQEVFANAAECWRQVDAILAARAHTPLPETRR
jgi:very-short-patch-repair endonuclease